MALIIAALELALLPTGKMNFFDRENGNMKISFHTDASNSAAFSFEKALIWAQQYDVLYRNRCYLWCIADSCLGYLPHVSLSEDNENS